MKLLPVSLLAVSLALGWLPALAGAAPVVLLTKSEASRPDAPPKADIPSAPGTAVEKAEPGTAPVPGAPQIVVDMPEPGTEVAAPFPVKIRFVPSAGARIKLDTLKIEVLKLIPISLLSRVRPYLSAAGINVPEARIPSGNYNVRIAVADDQGREGMTVQVWTVK